MRAAALAGLGRAALDLVLPPRCLSCATVVDAPGSVCPGCWQGLRFIAGGTCACCGVPLGLDLGADAVCAACIADPPPFARARAALLYDDASRPLLLAFKHGDRLDAAPLLGRWTLRAAAALADEADVIAPVPLHWTRLFSRRYNQSALLAQAMGRAARRRVIPDLLLRRRRTGSQGGLGRSARARNVAGAFAVAPRWRAAVEGRRVLLVDDVLTTGATVGACAAVLRRSGASAVDVATVARVDRPRTV